ncbi:MAG: MATE family efflux transporter [Clostridium sp.]|nr:MATE family efflux transporter [Clostridium sp.]MCM1548254.1 MATE family efflux transporter [Ruminococcus sp.]
MAMTKEMTSGKPYKLILSFAIPMIIGNVFQQLYNMVDTVIVGKYCGVNALAGVGSTGAISFLVIGFALGSCSGFSIMTAQCFGAGDYSEMRKYTSNAMYLCAAVAIALTTVTMLMTRTILTLMNTPDEIFEYAYNYIIIIFAGIPATIFYNILSGILRALGDSKTPLIFLIISSALNVALDLICIVAFDMNVSGAGIATVISQGVSGVLCLIYMKKKYTILKFEKDELKFDLKKTIRHISVGIPMALQFSITAIGSIILQGSVNTLGTASVAAVTAASKIQTVAISPMESLGITMSTYCGQNKGAGKYTRIRVGMRQSIIISMIYCVISALVVSFLGGALSGMFVSSKQTTPEEFNEIISLSVRYLRLNGIFYPMLGILFILRTALQGMGYSFLPMMAGVSELAARTLVSVIFVSVYGYTAACAASPVAWIFADVLLVITYFAKMRSLKNELVFRRRATA